MQILYTFTILLFLINSSIGQRDCGTMQYLDYQMEQDSKRKSKLENIEKFTSNWIKQHKELGNRNIISIPVVFHVVYNIPEQNLSDSRLQEQLDVINADFNSSIIDVGDIWPQAANVGIEFCLATIDPRGNTTSGITRTETNKNVFGANNAVKYASSGGKDSWPSTDYLNIWICNIDRILGYAQFPGGDPQTDGVVLDYKFTGLSGATAPFNHGRTATHEIGHWLNLRHIWGDGGCNVDDNVADTPPSDGPNFGCQHGHVSCGTVDMIENFMDYTDDACMKLFTNGQKSRMLALFGPNGPRESLLYSNGCGVTVQDSFVCETNTVDLSIVFDNYPEETSWSIIDSIGTELEKGGAYGGNYDGSQLSDELCLPDGCYTFIINDSYGDGICCSYGQGQYTIAMNGDTLASGGAFTYGDSTWFCLDNNVMLDSMCYDGIMNGDETGIDCGGACQEQCISCSDGIQNGSETGIDCGGPDCLACEETTGSTEILASYFEEGMDEWIDGGSDCYRYSGIHSYEGQYSIRIRDNSGYASSLLSPALDLTSYNTIEMTFYFYPNSMEDGERFLLQFRDNLGWHTLSTWVSGTDFDNDVFYTSTINISSSEYSFDSNNQLKFTCDASGNADRIYLDQITIAGNLNTTMSGQRTSIAAHQIGSRLVSEIEDVQIFPNPATNYVNISAEESIQRISIRDLRGAAVINQYLTTSTNSERLDISTLDSGVYLITISTEEESTTKKIIKY